MGILLIGTCVWGNCALMLLLSGFNTPNTARGQARLVRCLIVSSDLNFTI